VNSRRSRHTIASHCLSLPAPSRGSSAHETLDVYTASIGTGGLLISLQLSKLLSREYIGHRYLPIPLRLSRELRPRRQRTCIQQLPRCNSSKSFRLQRIVSLPLLRVGHQRLFPSSRPLLSRQDMQRCCEKPHILSRCGSVSNVVAQNGPRTPWENALRRSGARPIPEASDLSR
jgi:hypothetical protein